MKEELSNGDYKLIAQGVKCSRAYVCKVINGERSENSVLAQKILYAQKILLVKRREFLKEVGGVGLKVTDNANPSIAHPESSLKEPHQHPEHLSDYVERLLKSHLQTTSLCSQCQHRDTATLLKCNTSPLKRLFLKIKSGFGLSDKPKHPQG